MRAPPRCSAARATGRRRRVRQPRCHERPRHWGEARHDARRRAVPARMRAWRDGRVHAARVARAGGTRDTARSRSCGRAVQARLRWRTSRGLRTARRAPRSGEGVPQDIARAAGLFRQSCDTLVAAGCLGLAELHLAGTGVPRQDSTAIALLELGCGREESAACFRLGTLFEAGEHVAQNYERAATTLSSGMRRLRAWRSLRAARADVRCEGPECSAMPGGGAADPPGLQARLHRRVSQAEGGLMATGDDPARRRAPDEAVRQRRRAQRRQLHHLRRHHRHPRRERRRQEHGDQDLSRPAPADVGHRPRCSARTRRRASACARGSATCRSTTACRAR